MLGSSSGNPVRDAITYFLLGAGGIIPADATLVFYVELVALTS